MHTRALILRITVTASAVLLLTLTAAMTAGGAQAAPRPTPVLTVVGGCDGAKQVRPVTLSSIYCGDAGIILGQISWLGWTDGWAAGYGTEYRKTCRPNCATGGVAKRTVGIWLFAPSRGAFTKVSLYSSVTAPPETFQLTGFVRR